MATTLNAPKRPTLTAQLMKEQAAHNLACETLATERAAFAAKLAALQAELDVERDKLVSTPSAAPKSIAPSFPSSGTGRNELAYLQAECDGNASGNWVHPAKRVDIDLDFSVPHITCTRCGGSGIFQDFGTCYRCQGRGILTMEDKARNRAVFAPKVNDAPKTKANANHSYSPRPASADVMAMRERMAAAKAAAMAGGMAVLV